MAVTEAELLEEVQRLEDEGFIVFLKWDGERKTGKKTLAISKPGTDIFVRRDSDNMWDSLESALMEVRALNDSKLQRAEQDDIPKPRTVGIIQQKA